MATTVTRFVSHYKTVSKKLRGIATQLKDFDPEENEVSSLHANGEDILSCIKPLDKMMQLFENKEFAGTLAENIALTEFEQILDQISSESQQLVETDDIINKSPTLGDETAEDLDAGKQDDNKDSGSDHDTNDKNNESTSNDNDNNQSSPKATATTATTATTAPATSKGDLLGQIEAKRQASDEVGENIDTNLDLSVFDSTILHEVSDVNKARMTEICRSYNHLKNSKRNAFGKWKVYAQYRADKYILPFRETV